MNCAWKELLDVLPEKFRWDTDRLGKEKLQELRLRLGGKPELVLGETWMFLQHTVTREDIMHCINTASRYSPWCASTVSQGFITSLGGHRIGLCGEVVIKNGKAEGIRSVSSLCIRIARDIPGIAAGADDDQSSVLIIGPPGSGKTTLLRDLIRRRSETGRGCVAVVDERGELFPAGNVFDRGKRTDVLTGCDKGTGIDMVLRTMGPSCIAVDEITSERDCQAMIRAGWCGVSMLATAHASSKMDLYNRTVYQPLVRSGIFETLLMMQRDKSWRKERMEL